MRSMQAESPFNGTGATVGEKDVRDNCDGATVGVLANEAKIEFEVFGGVRRCIG